MDRNLDADRKLEVVARNDCGRREPADDLVGDVGAGEHRNRPSRDEGRERRSGRRIEPLRETEDRRVAGQVGDDLAEHAARDRENDELGVGERRFGDRRRFDSGQVRRLRVARVSTGLRDCLHLCRIARRERHLVPVVAEEAGERRSPRAGADDDGLHSLVTKSIDTGTPSRPKRARSSFSTQ